MNNILRRQEIESYARSLGYLSAIAACITLHQQGLTAAEIGKILNVSDRSVFMWIRQYYKKLRDESNCYAKLLAIPHWSEYEEDDEGDKIIASYSTMRKEDK